MEVSRPIIVQIDEDTRFVAIRERRGRYTVFVADAAGRLKTMLHRGVRVDQILGARALKDVREALGDRVEEAVRAIQQEELGEFLERVVEGRTARIEFKPFVELSDGRLAEECYNEENDEVYYAVYDPRTGKIKRAAEVYDEKRGVIYRPIYTEELKARQVLLPSWPEEYGSEEELDREIEAHLDKWHEQLDRMERLIDVAYVKLTYIYDLLPAIPYRRALAGWGEGKTTYLETIGFVCYRPMLLAGCDTEAAIRKTFDTWRGTAIIDEADFVDSSLYATIIKILNIGDRKSTGWYKKCDKEDPERLLIACVYGPKVLATRARYKDVALESRCLTFIGRRNVEPRPLFRHEGFMRECLMLRNKLLMWRFRNYHKVKEAMKRIEGTELFKEVYGEDVEGLHPRVKQVFLPLGLIAPDERKRELLERAAAAYEMLKSIDEEALLVDQVEDAITELIAEKLDEEGLKAYAGEESESGEDLLEHPLFSSGVVAIPLADISRRVAGEEADVKEVRAVGRKVRRIITDRLGFEVKVQRKARKRIVYVPIAYAAALIKNRGCSHKSSPSSLSSPTASTPGEVRVVELPKPYTGRCAWCGREAELRYSVTCGGVSGHACQKCRDEIAGGVRGRVEAD